MPGGHDQFAEVLRLAEVLADGGWVKAYHRAGLAGVKLETTDKTAPSNRFESAALERAEVEVVGVVHVRNSDSRR